MATLEELAALIHGEIDGDSAVEITGVAEIHNAAPGTISFLHDPRYRKYLKTTQASALVVTLEEDVGHIHAIRVGNPALSFTRILDHFSPSTSVAPGIHSTAVIGEHVRFGENVSVGAYAVIEDGADVGDNVIIGPHSVVGRKSKIGEATELKFHTTIYHRCVIGNHVTIHSGTVIGSDGFGYITDDGIHHKTPQTGCVVVGDNVEIGAGCTIDRGTIGDTVIGDGSKLDNLVHIAHNVKLGKGCLVAALVGIAGSSVVGDYVAFGGQAGVVNHVEIGSHARLAAKTGVTKSLPGGKTYAGMPAREIMEKSRSDALVRRLPDLVRKVKELESEISKLREDR
ncbi:MAG: UDP-3-O-(3-hydroxymyristoyl)glucosamine N-acyltransferase [Candidatus Neomarinimicrobiota bacterium]